MHFFIALFLLPLAALATSSTVGSNNYVVMLKQSSVDIVEEILDSLGLEPDRTYTKLFQGFAARLTPLQLTALQLNPNVTSIENDAVMKTSGAISKRALTTESNAPWGLGRISHTAKGSTNYIYDTTAGSGTCSYVLDTGIYTANNDFGGRATFLANFDTTDNSNNDLLGHGTHVAGILGSTTYGVAKKTQLYSVKVCNQYGDCNLSNIIAGIQFAVQDYQSRICPNGGIINMSFGAPDANYQSINQAVAVAVNAGIFVAVAAGNNDTDTKGYSPASSPGACAVGAINSTDSIASFSNYGSIVAVFAPGVNVLSTWIGSPTATAYQDGTSMSAPHVAGLGAYFMGLKGKQNPVGLCVLIENTATKNAISGLPSGTNNRLAYNGDGS